MTSITHIVRVLVDAIAPKARVKADDVTRRAGEDDNSKDAEEAKTRADAQIGHAFVLGHLVMVSPDIPAEALMIRRGNFLKSSLRRFQEVHLFCNAGDEVLRTLSSLANFFSFPMRTRERGYRLGNAELVGGVGKLRPAGIVKLGESMFTASVRVGTRTLAELIGGVAGNPDADYARMLNFFDCTAYRDEDTKASPVGDPLSDAADGRGVYKEPGALPGLLTGAGRRAQLSFPAHAALLARYAFAQGAYHVDVHGGYFDGPSGRALIYRLACLGYEETLRRLCGEGGEGGEDDDLTRGRQQLHAACERLQIGVLLSKDLNSVGAEPSLSPPKQEPPTA